MNLFETKYGRFSENGNEYIIKTPHTPRPWVNVISNGRYGLTISQAGGGFSWLDHSEYNRLNRWHQDLVQDNWGKYLYFKDLDSGEIWSPTWLPARTELDKYQCAHGFGYTRFTAEYKGIHSILTIFVPTDQSLEIWDIKVESRSGKKRRIELITYLEWCLGSSADHHREFHKTFIETKFDKERNSALATKRLWDINVPGRGYWNKPYPYIGFLTCNKPFSNFEFDKDTFIGQFGNLQKPAVVEKGGMRQQQGSFYDAIAGTSVLLSVDPGEEIRVDYLLGLAINTEEIDRFRADLFSSQAIDEALDTVHNFWLDTFGKTEVKTPDDSLNLLTNKWLRYQAISGRLWARTAYYQQSGAYGFRDQLQDSQIFLQIDPQLTAKHIRLHAEHQFKDGHVLHWWHPITDDGLNSNFSDDFLWLPFITLNYLEETADYEFLNESIKYYDQDEPAPLMEHCTRAIEYALGRMSERGIPLIGSGDWNDGLSATGIDMKGESFWIIHFLNFILVRFADLQRNFGNIKIAEKYDVKAKQLRKKLLEVAWDGEWFIRATKDNGEIIGSSKNKEGKIFLNAQTWSVIADSAPPEFQRKSMDSVAKHLMKNNGPLLLCPSYSEADEFIGYLSRYAAGARENGGVYTHAATWAIWAFAKIGQNNLAFQVFKGVNPILNGLKPDRYKGEPYVTPGNIDGPDSPYYGRGGWTWYTGSAAWLQKCTMDWIIGVRASQDGLIVDPHIPLTWKTYSVKRLFRGTEYNIQFKNVSGRALSVKKILVKGREIKGNVIPISKQKTCLVEVTL